jgi:hypothetical protein
MKTRIVPAKELTTKTLRAKDYVEPKGSKKMPKGECPWCHKPGYEKGKQCKSCTFTEGAEHWVRYISATHINDEFFDHCRYAVAKITMSFRDKLKKRKDVFDRLRKADKDLLYVEYWDDTPDFYESNITDVEIEGSGHIIDDGALPTGAVEPERVECCSLIISEQGFYWSCFPKHVDVTVETDCISWKEIGL